MAKQRASVLLIVLGLVIVLFLLYRRYNKSKEGFLTTAPIVPRVMSSPGYITTIAGNGTNGTSGDGGAATSSVVSTPLGIIIDSANNIYFTNGNNRVRMISGTTGIITTVAGGGTAAPNNVAATSAIINCYGLGLDLSGNLYIADSAGNKIYMVAGPNTNTSPYVPSGTAVKPGFIYTIAGAGTGFSGDGGPPTSAKFYNPKGVTVDASGNLYIADQVNCRIRMIAGPNTRSSVFMPGTTLTPGFIYTITGNGGAGWFVVPAGQTMSDGIPSLGAVTANPVDVKVDKYGNIYFTSGGPSQIMMLAASATVNPFPTLITKLTAGNVYRLAGPSGANQTDNAIASSVYPGTVIGFDLDKYGNIYWAQQINHTCIRRLTAQTGIVNIIGGLGIPYGNWAAGSTPNGVTGSPLNDNGSALLAFVNYPTSCTVDSSGNVYFSDTYNCRIRKIEYIECVPNSISCKTLTDFVCAPGFSNTGTACAPCPAGYYCSGTSNTGCQIGTSSEQWSSNATSCTNCSVGTYNSIVGGVCLTCPANNATCSTSNFTCLPGFSNTGTACVKCPNGWSCSGTVNSICIAGTYSTGGQATCSNCTAGSTYNPLTGQSNCIACPANTATCITTSYTCASGYSNNGSNCIPCPPGFACSGTANTPCAAGNYSPGAQVTCTQCGAGTYTNLTGQSNCITCPANSVCAPGGSNQGSLGLMSLVCQPGFSNTGTACVTCPQGYACSGTTNTPCATGTYSTGGQVTCSNCAAGTYTNLTGQSACITCPANSVCASDGAQATATGLKSLVCSPSFSNTGTACATCPPGYACSGTANSACATGTYSAGGLNTCKQCGAGTYVSATGQTACLSCPVNSTCTVGGTQAGATGLAALTCQPGFSNTGTECTTCPPGFACSGTTNSACALGTYSTGGQVTCSNCAAGTYNTTTGSTNCPLTCPVANSVSCISPTSFTCAAGYYSNAGGCKICPTGSTCSPKGNAYLPGQTSFSPMSGWTRTGDILTKNQYASRLPPFTQGSVANMNLLLDGNNSPNCDMTNSCTFGWTRGSNVISGPISANPCIPLRSWYDFDKQDCVSATGGLVTTINCTSNTVYIPQVNACVPVRKPFSSQPLNTVNSPSLTKPGDFGDCKTTDIGDCTPYYKSDNVFTKTNPCKPPSKYDFQTQSCTKVNECCGLTPQAASSNINCMPYVIPSQVFTKNPSKCPATSKDKCCSAANQRLAACASFWSTSNVFTYSPAYAKTCGVSGFQDYNNGIDTIAEKRSKWAENRELINA